MFWQTVHSENALLVWLQQILINPKPLCQVSLRAPAHWGGKLYYEESGVWASVNSSPCNSECNWMPLIVKNDRFYAKLFVLFPCFFSWRGARQ